MSPEPPTANLVEEIRRPIEAGQADAQLILATAVRRAREIQSDEAAAAEAERRLRKIVDLCAYIDAHAQELERKSLEMVNSISARVTQLIEVTTEADFTPPEWQTGRRRISGISLSETRELTILFGDT